MNRSVTFESRGSSGSVIYSDSQGVIKLEWEFGRTVVVFVYLPPPDEWGKLYPWSIKRKDEILKFICAEIIQKKARGCIAEIQSDKKAIYIKSIETDER